MVLLPVVTAVLISTNYIYVMWNRAALMEGTMTAMAGRTMHAAGTASLGRALHVRACAPLALVALLASVAAAQESAPSAQLVNAVMLESDDFGHSMNRVEGLVSNREKGVHLCETPREHVCRAPYSGKG